MKFWIRKFKWAAVAALSFGLACSATWAASDVDVALSGLTGSARYAALKNLSDTRHLSGVYSPDEIDAIIAGMESLRRDTLYLLWDRIQPNLTSAQVVQLLRPLTNGDRYTALKNLSDSRRLSSVYSPDDVDAIVAGMESLRRDALYLLWDRIQGNLTSAQIVQLLRPLTNGDRYTALKNLSDSRRLLSVYSPDEVDAIIVGMESQRRDVLYLMWDRIQGNLTTAQIVQLLRPLTNGDRYTALKNLSDSRRLLGVYSPNEVDAIIAGMEPQRRDVLYLMWDRIQGNLTTAQIVQLLRPLTNSERYTALKNLSDSRRLLGMYSPDDVDAIITGMESLRRDVLYLMWDRIQGNLTTVQIVQLLRPLTNTDRYAALKNLSDSRRLSGPYSPNEVNAIIAGMEPLRRDVLYLLWDRVKGNLTSVEVAQLLDNLTNGDRETALKNLGDARRLSRQFAAAEVAATVVPTRPVSASPSSSMVIAGTSQQTSQVPVAEPSTPPKPTVQPVAQQQINSPPLTIEGYSDGLASFNGRWTGQPSDAPKSAPKYSNNFKGDLVVDVFDYRLIGETNPYYWDIKGQNFGNTLGEVWLTHAASGPSPVKLTIVYWASSRIRVTPTAPINFTNEGIRLHVRTAPTSQFPQGQTYSVDDKVVALIKSRGFGQCTWFVARTRLDQSRSIPTKAFDRLGSIPSVGEADNGYRPKQWDALTYGLTHVAIIVTTPAAEPLNPDGSTTWSFKLAEMNPWWDEEVHEEYFKYVLSAPDVKGNVIVLQGIGTLAGKSKVATGYYR